jgi:hypothetical protein
MSDVERVMSAPRDEKNPGTTKDDDDRMVWQIWVSEPINEEANTLLKWSRTSFFGGCPTTEPRNFDGGMYYLFQKCCDEWTVKYALSTAISNYRNVKLLRRGDEVSLDLYTKDLPRPSGKILGDAATMGRSGGMC